MNCPHCLSPLATCECTVEQPIYRPTAAQQRAYDNAIGAADREYDAQIAFRALTAEQRALAVGASNEAIEAANELRPCRTGEVPLIRMGIKQWGAV